MLKTSLQTCLAALALASCVTTVAATDAANKAEPAAELPLSAYKSLLASQTQQAIKSTNAESITIEIKNNPEGLAIAAMDKGDKNQSGELADLASSKLAQDPGKKQLTVETLATAATKETAEVVDAEQIGLFRIYRSNLLKLTYQHVIYPESAIDRNQQGNVVLRVTINRDGEVQEIKFKERAEFNSLNKAARKAVDNAKGSFPSAPERLRGESFEVTMPIKFRLSS